MTDRKAALMRLVIGDIFHAQSPGGASLICLVVAVTETTIRARTVTTQRHLEFDRKTGIAETGDPPVLCTVDSTAPLSVEFHNVMLGIDRKFRLEREPERLKLNDDETRALLYSSTHYASNQL